MAIVILVRIIRGWVRSAISPDVSISENDRQPLLSATDRNSQVTKGSSERDVEAQKTEEGVKKGLRIAPEIIRDAIIGLSDGLTVPFALTAGLSAFGDPRVVLLAGMAELGAGAISMGLGGYLGAKSEAASYSGQLEKTKSSIETDPEETMKAIVKVFDPYQVPPHLLDPLAAHFAKVNNLDQFLMKHYHCAKQSEADRPWVSGLTIALGYLFGGLVPLAPYYFAPNILDALYLSFVLMAIALFVFGYAKTCSEKGCIERKDIGAALTGGVQMVFIGGFAAISAMALVKSFSSPGGETSNASIVSL